MRVWGSHRHSISALRQGPHLEQAFVRFSAPPYEPGKTEEWRESFVKIQQTIEAVNRTIREEAELEGHKYPSEKQSERS